METRSSKKTTSDDAIDKIEKPSPPSKVNKRKPQAPKKQPGPQANQVQPPKVAKLDKTKQKALIRTQRYNSWEVKMSGTGGQPQYKRVGDQNIRVSQPQPKGANRRQGNSSKAE